VKNWASLSAIFLVISFVLVSFPAIEVKAQAKTIVVPDDYANIQTAISNVDEGGTIFVKGGVYFEHIEIDKSLFLVGEGKESTVINAQQEGPTILIRQNNVTLTGFTILNGITPASPTPYFPWVARPAGIHLLHVSNCNITNNKIENSGCGIWLYDSHDNQIRENQVINNSNSMRFELSSNNTIESNHLKNCFDGIIFTSSGNNIVKNNDIVNASNQFGVIGENISHYTNHIETSNKIDDKSIYYWIDKTNQVVPSDAGYVGLVNCQNITVQNTNITKNSEAILLAFTEKSIIANNFLVNNKFGVKFYESSNNLIIANSIIANSNDGIKIDASHQNNITQNTITNNKDSGISLHHFSTQNNINNNYMSKNYRGLSFNEASENHVIGNQISETFMSILFYSACNYNNIIANNMSNSDSGIWFERAAPYSKGNNIIGNNISSNQRFGILARSVSDNKIQNNTIKNNEYGILISGDSVQNNIITGNNITSNSETGLGLGRTSAIVYSNNFINNTQDVDCESTNIWNNEKEGNYWNNYTGIDNNHDGIGDTPHIINENNQDNYPLMNPIEIEVIPEFPSWLILPLFLVGTLSALVVKKRLFHQRTKDN
jgi:parallel beta-helix repeat protein